MKWHNILISFIPPINTKKCFKIISILRHSMYFFRFSNFKCLETINLYVMSWTLLYTVYPLGLLLFYVHCYYIDKEIKLGSLKLCCFMEFEIFKYNAHSPHNILIYSKLSTNSFKCHTNFSALHFLKVP